MPATLGRRRAGLHFYCLNKTSPTDQILKAVRKKMRLSGYPAIRDWISGDPDIRDMVYSGSSDPGFPGPGFPDYRISYSWRALTKFRHNSPAGCIRDLLRFLGHRRTRTSARRQDDNFPRRVIFIQKNRHLHLVFLEILLTIAASSPMSTKATLIPFLASSSFFWLRTPSSLRQCGHHVAQKKMMALSFPRNCAKLVAEPPTVGKVNPARASRWLHFP